MLKIDNNFNIIDKNKIKSVKEQLITGEGTVSTRVMRYRDHEGLLGSELYISFELPTGFKEDMMLNSYPLFAYLKADGGKLRIPVINGILRHYFKDYQDYYYFPEEDMAVHKSLAVFSDRKSRIRANASNACVKKEGCFLLQFGEEYQPSYKTHHLSNDIYFEIHKDFIDSEECIRKYLIHLLDNL